MFTGLCTASYPAPDLAATKKWYAEVLGVDPYFDEPFYVGFRVGRFELGLIPDETPGTTGPQPHWAVADVDAALARFVELGATVHQPVTDVGGGIRVASVIDPFGNRIEFMHNPYFTP